jgi:hypothetical protein
MATMTTTVMMKFAVFAGCFGLIGGDLNCIFFLRLAEGVEIEHGVLIHTDTQTWVPCDTVDVHVYTWTVGNFSSFFGLP